MNILNIKLKGKIKYLIMEKNVKTILADIIHKTFLGPLTAEIFGKTTLVGLVSFGQYCADPNYPGVYSRVTDNIDWIFQNSDAKYWQCSRKRKKSFYK